MEKGGTFIVVWAVTEIIKTKKRCVLTFVLKTIQRRVLDYPACLSPKV